MVAFLVHGSFVPLKKKKKKRQDSFPLGKTNDDVKVENSFIFLVLLLFMAAMMASTTRTKLRKVLLQKISTF